MDGAYPSHRKCDITAPRAKHSTEEVRVSSAERDIVQTRILVVEILTKRIQQAIIGKGVHLLEETQDNICILQVNVAVRGLEANKG